MKNTQVTQPEWNSAQLLYPHHDCPCSSHYFQKVTFGYFGSVRKKKMGAVAFYHPAEKQCTAICWEGTAGNYQVLVLHLLK